ncbi:insulinase family protein [Patescibacteria group bacterium]|mgnify:CR=1 FL=1|nr:insulinase family protein [Patescibacteria group bacterium]
MISYTKDVLPSGLTIIRVPMPAVESVTVLALVNVGSRYEEPRLWGISHFLEHMVFKGTEQYPDAQSLAAAVDAIGAKFNAFTSKEYTGYYVKATSKGLDLALNVVSDMLLTPKLRQEDIDREKGVIIEEINMYADMPASHIATRFEQLVYNEKTLGHDIIGTKETVSAFTTADFQNHLHTWYGRHNIVLILSGDAQAIQQPQLLEKVDQLFQKGDSKQRLVTNPAEHYGEQPLTDRQLLVEHRTTEQAHFVLGFPALRRTDKRRPALSVLNVLLGGNMSSRLFSEVREKRGLCYYIHSDVDFYHDAGLFGGSAGVDPKRVEEAVTVTLEEFFALGDGSKPVTESELQRAKDYITGKFVLDLEDSESVAQYFGMKQLLQGEVETPDQLLKRYMAVSLDEINHLAQEILLPDHLRFAVIGPFEDKSKFEGAIAQAKSKKTKK